MLVLLLIAVVFMVWPIWRYKRAAVQANVLTDEQLNYRLAENVRLFREHLAELENNLASQLIDNEQYAQLKVELERNLLDDEVSLRAGNAKASSFLGLKISLFFFVIVLAAGGFLYYKFGSAEDVALQAEQEQKNVLDEQDIRAGRNPDSARARALIVEYKERVKHNPDNVQYWFLLARAQMEVGDFAQAVPAYQQILQLDKKSPMIMAEAAQAMFLRDGNKITPPVVDLAQSALTLDPKNLMALGLLGIDAFNRKAYKEAIQYWQKTVDIMGADSPTAETLLTGIARAKQQYVQEGGKLEDLTAKSVYAVQVNVSLGDKVKASPEQIVFIYARTWQGTPMPLAIARVKVADLPTQVTLDESMAMSPMTSLATAQDIEVVARISTDGTAKTKPGDWQAKQGPISMKAIPEKIDLRINEQVNAE